ncbi:hypothetical protein, partial [Klebsiella pneumoniae]|uniref:hypothetical protein n=1 Tax=Klebsiella pneumoniae TaxID=573 RepID=UPI0019552038
VKQLHQGSGKQTQSPQRYDYWNREILRHPELALKVEPCNDTEHSSSPEEQGKELASCAMINR